MKENDYPPGAWGFSLRLLAYDEAEGCKGRVARIAFRLFQRRQRLGLSGSSEGDWKEAEIMARHMFARDIVRKLA